MGTANETVFVGGYGVQYLFGGGGPNIFRYLAFSDSPNLVGMTDAIGNFNPAKDVIDLSAIDADPANGGRAAVHLHRRARNFSDAGAQVRVVQNASANTTYVQATMAGSSYPTLQIRLPGLVNLTAANFALTPAQSNLLQGDTTALHERQGDGDGGVSGGRDGEPVRRSAVAVQPRGAVWRRRAAASTAQAVCRSTPTI